MIWELLFLTLLLYWNLQYKKECTSKTLTIIVIVNEVVNVVDYYKHVPRFW
jgi:hypothetical protein